MFNFILQSAKILSNTDADLYYEFMDAKRNAGPEYLGKLHQIYKYKFANKHFDALLLLTMMLIILYINIS